MQMSGNRRNIVIAQLRKRIHVGVAGGKQFLEHLRRVLSERRERRPRFTVIHAGIVLPHHLA